MRIGEAAKLLGVTPKTVRHYEKIGLLKEPERSEGGYRLYSAEDLLRLHRIRRLQALGLSLGQVKAVLGEGDHERSLEDILKRLLDEVEARIAALEERRRRIRSLLAGEETEAASTPSFERAMDLLGEQLSEVSAATLEQEKGLWAVLDSFEWPEGYDEENEKLFRYFAEHPEEYGRMLALGERLTALADVPEDDPEVGRVANAMVRHFEDHPLPEEYMTRTSWSEGPLERIMPELVASSLPPAQRRCMELMFERLAEAAERSGERAGRNQPGREP